MQLDRPTKRRPRRGRGRQERPERDKPPTQRGDPFQPIQDPFQVTPPGQKRVSFAPPQKQDPFQSPGGDAFAPFGQAPSFGESAPAFGQPFGQPAVFGRGLAQPAAGGMAVEPAAKEAAFKKVTAAFGQPAGGMTIDHFGKAVSPFKKHAATLAQPSGMTIEPSGKPAASFKKASNFRQQPSGGMIIEPSSRKPATSARAPPSAQKPHFGQKSVFGRMKPFAAAPSTFADDADRESDAFAKSAPETKHARTPTRRRTRSSEFGKTFDYQPVTQRERDSDADFEIEPDSDTPQQTPDMDRKRSQAKNQLLLKSVPLQLFSRAAIQRHFSAVQGVHVTFVSLRGSRRPDSRRTALITFSNEQQALTALRNGNNFKGSNLQLSIFRQNTHAEQQPVNETNELFFNYVPESLFSDESIKDLFDSISDNSVANVSLKQRPHYGSVKRTAIVTFTSADAAGMALRNLPLYKGRTLTVSFRRSRSRPNNATAAPAHTKRYDTGDSDFAKVARGKPQGDGTLEEDGAFEEDVPVNLQNQYGGEGYAGDDSIATDEDADGDVEDDVGDDAGEDIGDGANDDVKYGADPSRAGMGNAEGQPARKKMAERQAEIFWLKAEILRKEKERSLMTERDKGKRQKKHITPKRGESSKTEQEASNSGWRKVGEKVDIKNATSFVGTCMTMCPYKEFQDRIVQRDVSIFEMDDEGEPTFTEAVKKYRRSAAISEQPSPDEVRPPDVLLNTMEHLKKISDSTKAKFADVHNFVRDRTRSVRQDFTLQGVRDESCIKIHEESVRFHILSEHRLYGTDPALFSSKQNLEQLDKCLISLREMYDLRRDNDLDTSPNEPEMQAYYILTQMSDPKTCVQLCTGFAQDVRCSREVQFALQVVRAASEGFGSFTRYFSLVRSAPYLMACLMHSRFSAVRARALAVINATHGNPNSGDNIPISALTRQLGFEDDEEAEDFCDTLGMKIESVVLPSTPSEVVTIRTPSESFDETNVSEWESTRADILIESKVEGVKTSEIISGSGRKDFKLASPLKMTSKAVKTKKEKALEKQAQLFPQLKPKGSPKITRTAADLPPFAKPKITAPPTSAIPLPPMQGFRPSSAFELRPKKDQRKDDDLFKAPQSLPVKSFLAKSPKRQRSFQLAPKPVSVTPVDFLDGKPPLTTTKPAVSAVSTPFPLLSPTTLVKSQGSGEGALPGIGLSRSEKVVALPPQEDAEVPVSTEPQDQAVEASRRDASSVVEPYEIPTALDLEKAARQAAVATLVSDLIRSSETDFEKVRRIIDDAQTGTLRFPKAMEIWDDAKDILLAASEKIERGSMELAALHSPEVDEIHGSNAKIGDFRKKLQLCSQEGTELWDQLDEIFSKSLALATAHLRDSAHRPSALPRALQSSEAFNQLSAFPYGVDDEDVSFEVREVPDRGAEVQSIINAMNSMALNRWQAVIADLKHLKTYENEVGIAQRWLRQRLSIDFEQDSSALCLLDGAENGSPSISIREVEQISSIPYTTSLVVVPCDIRTMESSSSSAWALLEQILRKNRSIALSCDLPPPILIILYYCGSSDMPSWFSDENSTGMSFATFQKGLQDKGYVSTCRKLELSRTSAFEYTTCDPFTALMNSSVRASVQGLTRIGNVARPTNLRDHLVYVANSAVGTVLDSTSLQGDSAALHAVHGINESWKDVARLLRREEARWPKEMATRTRLMDAYMSIETKLQLPEPRDDALLSDYISDLAAVAGIGVPAHQQLDDTFSFCSALSLVMNAFVRRQLADCAASIVYLPVDYHDKVTAKKGKPVTRYHINPPKMQERGEEVTSKYTPRTEPERKSKRLRDEISPTDGLRRPRYPLRRRLSVTTVDPTLEERLSSELVSKRRRSLPASYGRRRMFELFDGLCSEEQAFGDLIAATMDALAAKRRRLERYSEVLAT